MTPRQLRRLRADATLDERWLHRAHADLVADGVLAPMSEERAEARLWLDCEIASLVENRFFEPLDPRRLSRAARGRWEERVLAEGEHFLYPPGRSGYMTPYWILEDGERAGTVGLCTSGIGSRYDTVSCLYVFPDFRGRGIAGRMLRRAKARITARGGWGLRVPTHWTWQPAVRFYMGLGLWVVSWKHSLVLGWYSHLPGRAVEQDDDEARFRVLRNGRRFTRIVATRSGQRLVWRETVAHARTRHYSLHTFGTATFALALAVAGWPLIRSARTWAKRHHWSDIGEPEGLAYKIEVFEALDRQEGFVVRTPRIPGLRYRDLDAID